MPNDDAQLFVKCKWAKLVNFSFELGHNSLNPEEPIQGLKYQFECSTYEWNDSKVKKYKIQRSLGEF